MRRYDVQLVRDVARAFDPPRHVLGDALLEVRRNDASQDDDAFDHVDADPARIDAGVGFERLGDVVSDFRVTAQGSHRVGPPEDRTRPGAGKSRTIEDAAIMYLLRQSVLKYGHE